MNNHLNLMLHTLKAVNTTESADL